MNFCEDSYYNRQMGSFYEFSPGPFQTDLRAFSSMHGRLCCFKALIKKGLMLPLFLVIRGLVTLFRAFGVMLSALLMALSLANSEKTRNFFLRRVSFFARDLADWVFVPFIIGKGFFILLAGCVHPALYFR